MDSNKKHDSWSKDFEIGIATIDRQFVNLFSIYDQLLDIKYLATIDTDAKLRDVLERLEKFTEQYAILDNSLVKTDVLSDVDQYVVNYQKLMTRIEDFILQYNAKNPILIDEMIEFLKKWLMAQLFQARKVFVK
jgi:hemerythrin